MLDSHRHLPQFSLLPEFPKPRTYLVARIHAPVLLLVLFFTGWLGRRRSNWLLASSTFRLEADYVLLAKNVRTFQQNIFEECTLQDHQSKYKVSTWKKLVKNEMARKRYLFIMCACKCISHLPLSSLAFWFTFPRNTRCLDRWKNANTNSIFP